MSLKFYVCGGNNLWNPHSMTHEPHGQHKLHRMIVNNTKAEPSLLIAAPSLLIDYGWFIPVNKCYMMIWDSTSGGPLCDMIEKHGFDLGYLIRWEGGWEKWNSVSLNQSEWYWSWKKFLDEYWK